MWFTECIYFNVAGHFKCKYVYETVIGTLKHKAFKQ